MEKNAWKRKLIVLSVLLFCLLLAGSGFTIPQPMTATYARGEAVYIGGMPIGVTINLNSVVIVGKGEVITSCGVMDPTLGSDIQIGDILLELDGVKVEKTQTLIEEMRKRTGDAGVTVKLKRGEFIFETVIHPALDVASDTYKLGLWVRDNAAGVGTMTYMKEDGSFGALGHPITDVTTGEILSVGEGWVYGCKIVGITKGARGRAGELKGMFVKSAGCIGKISENNKFGLYGKLDKVIANQSFSQPIMAAGRKYAKPGKAQIVTTIEGGSPKAYDISIVKCCNQAKAAERSMVIKVTDKELLEKAGGIVQGMSGSPILQDGRLVGAVTHVFINDPTRGYGLFIDWML